MPAFDVITIGDTSHDTILFIDEDEARVVCNVKKQACEVCFDYADKIPVKSIFESVGGNAANAAVGFSRLDLKAGIYTEIGDDELSPQILNVFKNEKVSRQYVHQKGKTNRSSIVSIQGERTIFSYHEKRDYKLPRLDMAKMVYISSLKTGFEKVYSELLDQIRNKKIILAYNPGTYQLKSNIIASQGILHKATVTIMNLEEASKWLELPVTIEIKKLLFELSKYGTKTAVITDSQNGSYGYDGINYYHCPIYPQKAVETTGAGDSYATALSAALFYGQSLKEAMRWGSINAASVVASVGSQAGLLKKNQMELRLKDHEKITATPILS